jgi:hypothetical protein
MGRDADEIVRRAWLELPAKDRQLLEQIRADQWQVGGEPVGTLASHMLDSAGCDSLSVEEIERANVAVALWVPQLRVVLINERHAALDGLDAPSFAYALERIAWHEWGHALSLDRAGSVDVAAGQRYLGLIPAGLAGFIREAEYRPREYTHEIVAEVYALLMIRRRQGDKGRPPWLHSEIYELVRRVAGWNQ